MRILTISLVAYAAAMALSLSPWGSVDTRPDAGPHSNGLSPRTNDAPARGLAEQQRGAITPRVNWSAPRFVP
jgi:hypothetical protein